MNEVNISITINFAYHDIGWTIGDCTNIHSSFSSNFLTTHNYYRTCCLSPGTYKLTYHVSYGVEKRRFGNNREQNEVSFLIQHKKYCEDIDKENELSNITISWDNTLSDLKSSSSYHAKSTKDSLEETKLDINEASEIDKANRNFNVMTKQVPLKIPPIFDGTRLHSYYFYSKDAIIPPSINMKADLPKGPLSIDISVDESKILRESTTIRKLAARKKIQELEESKNVELSVGSVGCME